MHDLSPAHHILCFTCYRNAHVDVMTTPIGLNQNVTLHSYGQLDVRAPTSKLFLNQNMTSPNSSPIVTMSALHQ